MIRLQCNGIRSQRLCSWNYRMNWQCGGKDHVVSSPSTKLEVLGVAPLVTSWYLEKVRGGIYVWHIEHKICSLSSRLLFFVLRPAGRLCSLRPKLRSVGRNPLCALCALCALARYCRPPCPLREELQCPLNSKLCAWNADVLSSVIHLGTLVPFKFVTSCLADSTVTETPVHFKLHTICLAF